MLPAPPRWSPSLSSPHRTIPSSSLPKNPDLFRGLCTLLIILRIAISIEDVSACILVSTVQKAGAADVRLRKLNLYLSREHDIRDLALYEFEQISTLITSAKQSLRRRKIASWVDAGRCPRALAVGLWSARAGSAAWHLHAIGEPVIAALCQSVDPSYYGFCWSTSMKQTSSWCCLRVELKSLPKHFFWIIGYAWIAIKAD